MNRPEEKRDNDDLEDYAETALPDGVTFEDALRGLAEVDPEAVKEAERAEKEARAGDDDAE